MRSTKSKNQNQQIPSEQGRAVIQSPICLISDHKGACSHPNCLKAYQYPQYFGISIAKFYNKHEFTELDVMSEYGNPHILPHNPNPGSDNQFELFRQSMNAVIHLAGKWPTDIKVVSKEHVEFKWAEYIDTVPSFNFDTLQNEWKQVSDVKQFAFYVGPTDNTEVQEINVNTEYGSQQLIITMASSNEKGGLSC